MASSLGALVATLSIAAFEFRFDVSMGTRASPLALKQAEAVAAMLTLTAPGTLTRLVPLEAEGDRHLGEPLSKVSFTGDLDAKVLDGELDLAVHSLKDIPPQNRWTAGLTIACHLPRESPLDALVGASSLEELPAGARVGTASVRRQAQLRAARPDLTLVSVRGSVEERLAQLDGGAVDALVMAKAGLVRLGVQGRQVCELPPEVMLPGAGQGVVCAVCRADGDALRLLRAADDCETHVAAAAERALLDAVDAAWAGRGRPPLGTLMSRGGATGGADGDWTLRGSLARPDGKGVVRVERSAPLSISVADAAALGLKAGNELLQVAAGVRGTERSGPAATAPLAARRRSIPRASLTLMVTGTSGAADGAADGAETRLVRAIQAQAASGQPWSPGLVAGMQGELAQLGLGAEELRDAAVAYLPPSGLESWGRWSQSDEEISLELCVGASTRAADVRVECLVGFLDVRCKDEPLLSGRLALEVRATELDWALDEAVDGERVLCVVLPTRPRAAQAGGDRQRSSIFTSLRVSGEEIAVPGLVAGAVDGS